MRKSNTEFRSRPLCILVYFWLIPCSIPHPLFLLLHTVVLITTVHNLVLTGPQPHLLLRMKSILTWPAMELNTVAYELIRIVHKSDRNTNDSERNRENENDWNQWDPQPIRAPLVRLVHEVERYQVRCEEQEQYRAQKDETADPTPPLLPYLGIVLGVELAVKHLCAAPIP